MQLKVSDVIAEFLLRHEIRHVFGIIGSGNAHIFDSITQKGYTEIVCVHHEQAAVMAMGTYYRMSGTISAALLTTGAGSTNAVTGVVSCWMDSIPGLLISGNENSRFTREENPLRIWGVQGYDSAGMVEKVTKYSNRILDPLLIQYELEKAYHIAGSGRKGPVWLDIPMNIQATPVESTELKLYEKRAEPLFFPTPEVSSLNDAVDEVVSLFQESKRPVIWLGHGIRLANSTALIPELLKSTGAAALVSWNGIDMIDSNHPQVFGRAGIYGQRAANFVLQNSDFLLTIGTRLAIPQIGYDLSELARAAKIAVVDLDPTEVTKHQTRVRLPICADARVFIELLLEKIRTTHLPSYGPWIEHCHAYTQTYPWIDPVHQVQVGQDQNLQNQWINSYLFMDRLSQILKPDQVVVTDMGTALLSGHQILKLKEGQRLLTSTGLGEMGFGLPAAIGASFARQRGEVLCLNCDGGMMMNLQELQTIAHHRLPIKVIIFNNDGYLMIKHTQKALFEGRYSGTNEKSGISCPNFTKLAQAFDFAAFQIKKWDEFDQVMSQVLGAQGPVFCEVFMNPEQYFYPKLGLVPQKDGSIISPPLEDLSPLLPRTALRKAMLVGLHPKSEAIDGNPKVENGA